MASARSQAVPQPLTLDERQLAAVEHVHGPMLVVAGAGTGKTTVLTRRIARLLRQGHARPDEVLALTYTENAAREMRERVQRELRGGDVSGLAPMTFHAYCNGILQRCRRGFGVLDEQDLWIYLRKRIRELRLNYFVRAANLGEFLSDLLTFLKRCQDELVGAPHYQEYVRRLECGELPPQRVTKSKHRDEVSPQEVLGRCREIANVYTTVERMLQEDNFGTFGHMIVRAYQLLEQDSAVLEQERARARFILVDEFQDANYALVKVIEKLAGQERNVFAVGDPDQAIYRFRGASSAAFEIFRRHFAESKLLVLDKNQRSTSAILTCAFRVIDKNPPLFSSPQGRVLDYQRTPLRSARAEAAAAHGKETPKFPVEVVLAAAREVEAAEVVAAIVARRKSLKCRWSDFAVLYRNHGHREPLAQELAARQIPFSIEGLDVMDTPLVRDLLACLGAVVSPLDSGSLFRVAALPQFRIDPAPLRAALKAAPQGAGMSSVLQKVEGGSAVLAALERWRTQAAQAGWKSRAVLDIILRGAGFDSASEPVRAFAEFVSRWEEKAITRTQEVGELLEYLEYLRESGGAIAMPARSGQDAVKLMTVHGAKGLEFPHVFVIRANANSFPASYHEPLVEFSRQLYASGSVAESEDKQLHEQEERRLFYVAMTRARDSLTLCAKPGKGKDWTPAGFLRPLLRENSRAPWLQWRNAGGLQLELEAGAGAAALSNVGAWLAMRPGPGLHLGLSATAVETYETCPLQFKLEREWRIPREVPAAMQYGAALHRVLRHYYDAVRFGRPVTEAEVMDFFRADFARVPVQDSYQRELYERQGVGQLRDFLAAGRELPPPEVLHTEQPFSIKIGEAMVAGRMDRVDRVSGECVRIIDYKTGKPRGQKDADASLQLSIYAIAARQGWGYNAEQLIFYNLEDNSAVVTSRSEPQLLEAQARVEDVAADIAAGKFPPKPDQHCRWCPYRNLCPATEKRLYLVDRAAAPGQGR